MNVNICFSPALYPFYTINNNRIVIVVDIFRATTTICMALNNGAASIIPVATVEEAKAYKDRGYLVGGERNVVKFEFSDFGNTPSEYTKEKVSGKDIVISTTNGTHAIDIAKDSENLIIGSFSNISTVSDFCIKQNKDILILCAGWQNKFSIEDTLFAGALAEKIAKQNPCNIYFDATTVSIAMWKEAQKNIATYIAQSEHWNRMKMHGLLDVANFCLEQDTSRVLPIYDKKINKIVL